MKKIVYLLLLVSLVLSSCIKNFVPPEPLRGVTVEVHPCQFSLFCVNVDGSPKFPDGMVNSSDNDYRCRITVYCYLDNSLMALQTVETYDMSSVQSFFFEELSIGVEYTYLVVQDFVRDYNVEAWFHSNMHYFTEFTLDRASSDNKREFGSFATAMMNSQANSVVMEPVPAGSFILIWYDEIPVEVETLFIRYDSPSGYICSEERAVRIFNDEWELASLVSPYVGLYSWMFFPWTDAFSLILQYEAVDASEKFVAGGEIEIPWSELRKGEYNVVRVSVLNGNLIETWCPFNYGY